MIQTRHHLVKALLMTMTGILLPTQAPADGKSSLSDPWPKDSYYKDYPMFHWYPAENNSKPQSVYRWDRSVSASI